MLPSLLLNANKFVFLEFILSFRVGASAHAGYTQSVKIIAGFVLNLKFVSLKKFSDKLNGKSL